MSYRISIDAGNSSTGVAVWSERDWERCVKPVRTELWRWHSKEERKKPWFVRAARMASRLDRLLCELRERVRVVYCEMPILFEGEFGHAVVAKGDLQKLTALVGAFLGVCSIHGIRFKPILVNEWKGQMPKPVVNRRIRAILGVDTKAYKRDEWDAVGVGLFAKGFFDGA